MYMTLKGDGVFSFPLTRRARTCNTSIMRLFLVFMCCAFYASSVIAEDFLSWKKGFLAQANAQGITKETLKKAFQNIDGPILKIIQLDRNQAEFKASLNSYQKDRLTPNIKLGRQHMENHKTLLNTIAQESGVPPEIIVALWGIETRFGKITGGFPVVHALATLAYEGRRRKFFEHELRLALQILQEGHVSLKDMQGSWAGAMGQCQFMPSSFLAHARDADGDGRKNIWTSHHDVFASIANYLKSVGWKLDTAWGEEVHVPEHMILNMPSEKEVRPVSHWLKVGIIPLKSDYEDLSTPASLIQVYDDKNARSITFMVYANFKSILKWNRSNFFSLTVCQLSDILKK